MFCCCSVGWGGFFLFAWLFWVSVFWILCQFMWVGPEFGSPSHESNAKHHIVALLIITKNCMYLTYIDPFRSPLKETRCSPTSIALNTHHDQSGRTKTKATSSPRENCFRKQNHSLTCIFSSYWHWELPWFPLMGSSASAPHSPPSVSLSGMFCRDTSQSPVQHVRVSDTVFKPRSSVRVSSTRYGVQAWFN